MSNNKNRVKFNNNDYDDDFDDYKKPKKKDSPRRQVKNWKKAWINNMDRYEEIDDFHSK